MSLTVSISPRRGIACMVISLAFFTLSDAVSKWLTQSYSVGEIVFIRSFFMYIPIAVMVWWRNDAATLRPRKPGWHLLRTILLIAATFLIITSLKLLPLADAVAFLFAAPLILTALATPLLGEQVGWRRWAAIIVGFVGVLIMTRPHPDAFQVASLLPIAAAATTALRDIVTRHMSGYESTNAILTWSILGLIVASGTTVVFGWTMPGGHDFLLMALSGVLVGLAHYFMVESYRLAQVAIVAPFKYSSILWGVLLGYAIWGELPDAWILGGMMLVIGSGLYILHREATQQ